MRDIAPNVVKWIDRMNSEDSKAGDYLANDDIPDSLLGLLKQQFIEFWPVQIDTLALNKRWIEENPKTRELPRMLGEHKYRIGRVTEKRVVRTFSQWKLQRVLDIYHGFSKEEKAVVDPLLHAIEGYEPMQTIVKKRVKRENNKLVVAGDNF